MNYAAEKGYSVFAVQYNSQCFTSADAKDTYKKYGESTGCSADGRGGGWAQNVYNFTCEKGNDAVGKVVSSIGINSISTYKTFKT